MPIVDFPEPLSPTRPKCLASLEGEIDALDDRRRRRAAEEARRATISDLEILDEDDGPGRYRAGWRLRHPRRPIRTGEGPEARHGGQQSLRVSLTGRKEDFAHRPLFDLTAVVQQRHPVRHLGHHAHVMGDQHDGGAELDPELAHQLQDLLLHRDVECRRGFVGDKDLGAAGQRHGDHDALAHAARQFMRILAHAPRRLGDVDGVEHGASAGFSARAPVGIVSADRFSELRADRHHRIQRRHWLLENHGDLTAAQPAHGAFRQGQEVAAGEYNRAAALLQRRRQEPHDGERRQRLARARLAREAQGLSGLERETHALEHGLQALRRPRVDREIADREDWVGHAKTRRGK